MTWLPGFLWRFGKFWRGLRTEVPWVDRAPWEIVRDHFRLTIQPFDAPDDPDAVERAIEHLRSDDILLYASDYPHWQFDGDAVMPAGLFAGAPAEDRDRQSARDLRPAQGGRAMNIEVRARDARQKTKLDIVDCDFHPQAHASSRCGRSSAISGGAICRPTATARATARPRATPIRRSTPQASRRDAWPPSGGLPASDLDFVPRAASRFLRHRARRS